MAKRFRKPKKRPSRIQQLANENARRDADLEELWDVLSESHGVPSWETPWRNGVNVVGLCLAVHRTLVPKETKHLDVVEELRRFTERTDEFRVDDYWTLQRVQDHLAGQIHYPWERMLDVGARSAQLVISASHGGGRVYNDLLQLAWPTISQLPRLIPDHLVRRCGALLREFRCKDALNVDPSFDGGQDDRLRRAFYTAWDRGLYQVAYAVGVR